MKQKPTILILYEYFFPGYKAGGPVQSLVNLITALQNEYSFVVITTAFDLISHNPYDTVQQNRWNNVSLPNGAEIKVWYAGKGKPTLFELNKLFKQINPKVIYLNGIYSYRLFLQPLLIHFFSPSAKIVICPRGMLQKGALSVKRGKKKYYIRMLQKSGLLKKCSWHSTNHEESLDIRAYFPVNKSVLIAPNIPKTPLRAFSILDKKAGKLKLVYLSLITEKKNLLLLLQIFQSLPNSVQLYIYGPVKDVQYWENCKKYIDLMPLKVKFMGDILPENVQQTLAQYHAMIILTKGENFGHALYESLSVGRPVITSYFTPWNNLLALKAGANVNISDTKDCEKLINYFASMTQVKYNEFCGGAFNFANEYFNNLKTTKQYRELFEIPE